MDKYPTVIADTDWFEHLFKVEPIQVKIKRKADNSDHYSISSDILEL